jgi:hypothetical protein
MTSPLGWMSLSAHPPNADSAPNRSHIVQLQTRLQHQVLARKTCWRAHVFEIMEDINVQSNTHL